MPLGADEGVPSEVWMLRVACGRADGCCGGGGFFDLKRNDMLLVYSQGKVSGRSDRQGWRLDQSHHHSEERNVNDPASRRKSAHCRYCRRGSSAAGVEMCSQKDCAARLAIFAYAGSFVEERPAAKFEWAGGLANAGTNLTASRGEAGSTQSKAQRMSVLQSPSFALLDQYLDSCC